MNLFIRTSIAPYRIDLYNALHTRLRMRMCFYHKTGQDQQFDLETLEKQCSFQPTYLKGVRLGSDSRKFCFGLGRMVRQETPDLVIVPEFQFPLFQMAWIRLFCRKKFRIVSMCDDSIDMIERENDFSWLHRMLRNWAPRLVDDIIVVSPAVQSWYRDHFGKGLLMPIMMDDGRTRERYEQLLPRSAAIVAEQGLQGRRVLLFVGRLVGLKQVDKLIKAFSMMGGSDVLVIIGDGPERERLKLQAKTSGKDIRFTGRLEGDNLYAWYNVGQLLVLPSKQEAFGAVVNEALLGGLHVVVSDRAGSSFLVTKENGAVVSIDDTEAFRAAIEAQLAEALPYDGTLRKNLMPFGFETTVQKLIHDLS